MMDTNRDREESAIYALQTSIANAIQALNEAFVDRHFKYESLEDIHEGPEYKRYEEYMKLAGRAMITLVENGTREIKLDIIDDLLKRHNKHTG